MLPPRSPLMSIRTRSSVAALVVLVAGLVGAHAWHPPLASAAPTPTSTPTPPAEGAGPTAVDDSVSASLSHTDNNGIRTIPHLAGATNDVAGSAAIVPSLTVFPGDQVASLPKGSVLDPDGKTLEVAGHGTFQINGDGSVDFIPWSRRTGTVSVHYRIVDANGATADGLLTARVNAGGERDIIETYGGVDVVGFDLLANDTPGRNADGTLGTLDRGSVTFGYPQFGSGVAVADDGHTLTLPGVGVAKLDGGLLTYESVDSGRSWEFSYQAQDTTVDASGTVVHHHYTVLSSIYNRHNQVLATTDEVKSPFDATTTVPGTLNDHDTNPKYALRPELSYFDDRGTDPSGYLSPSRRTIRYAAGRGTWTITDDGSVRYVPTPGYVGQDGIGMYIFDTQGNEALEALYVDVQPGPTAKPDTATLAQNVTTAVKVLANDVPGLDGHAKAGSMDATSVRFPAKGQPAGAVVAANQRTLTVPGQGVYTSDPQTGAISFDPEPTFVGTAKPVTYAAQDTVTRADGVTVVHNPVTSTLTVKVTAITPVALNNWTTTQPGHAVDIPVLGNDRPGAASAPLDHASVRLRLTAGLPTGSTLSAGAQTLTVAGRGTFAVRSDEVVAFTPAAGFAGQVPTIGYSVADTNGTRAIATITVRVSSAG